MSFGLSLMYVLRESRKLKAWQFAAANKVAARSRIIGMWPLCRLAVANASYQVADRDADSVADDTGFMALW